jgi:hypothetical protein
MALRDHMFMTELTLWSRVLFENPIVAQLVKKLPLPLPINPNVHYCTHNSTPLDPIISHMNSAHIRNHISLTSISNYPPIYTSVSQVVSSPRVFRLKCYMPVMSKPFARGPVSQPQNPVRAANQVITMKVMLFNILHKASE